MEEPKDLGLKIGTKKQAMWIKLKNDAEKLILSSEAEIMIQKEVIKFADKIIPEEEKK